MSYGLKIKSTVVGSYMYNIQLSENRALKEITPSENVLNLVSQLLIVIADARFRVSFTMLLFLGGHFILVLSTPLLFFP